MIRNPVTTITGLALLILSGLNLFGVIGPEEQTTLGEYVSSIITSIAGFIAIFKGGDKGGV